MLNRVGDNIIAIKQITVDSVDFAHGHCQDLEMYKFVALLIFICLLFDQCMQVFVYVQLKCNWG